MTANPQTEPRANTAPVRYKESPRWAKRLHRVRVFIDTLGMSEWPKQKKQS